MALTDATVIDNFFASVPFSLAGGKSSGDIDLSGTCGLLGGADGGAQPAQDNLAQVSFSVDAESAVTSAPEPSVLFELGTILVLVALRRRLFYRRP